MPVGEPFVINAKQVQDGRLKIMNSDEILGDIETNLIAGAVNHAAFNTGTCKPTAKRPCMMPPAGDTGRRLVRAAPKLRGEDHQCCLLYTSDAADE